MYRYEHRNIQLDVEIFNRTVDFFLKNIKRMLNFSLRESKIQKISYKISNF